MITENWNFSEVAILGVDQKERGLWRGEWTMNKSSSKMMFRATVPAATVINRISRLGHKQSSKNRYWIDFGMQIYGS